MFRNTVYQLLAIVLAWQVFIVSAEPEDYKELRGCWADVSSPASIHVST